MIDTPLRRLHAGFPYAWIFGLAVHSTAAGESPDDALERALRSAETPPAPSAAPEPSTPASPEEALDRALAGAAAPSPGAPPASSDIASRRVGGLNFRFIDISFDALFAAGSSTEEDESIQTLQGGGHDPHQRGFNVQNVELSFSGAVDPYVSGEAHLIFFLDAEGESHFELEEAFLTTQALPWGFQVEAGQMMTEFGRINPQHPHQWDWLDQPVVNTRMFGPDGMRAPGVRVGWLSPLPWYSEIHGGMQNAKGETMASFYSSGELFEERPIAGRPFVEGEVHTFEDFAYLVRWDNGFDITDELSTKLGASLVYGPNATGPDGFTRVYGADLVLKWRPLANERGWPFLVWQSEIMKRDYLADDAVDEGDPADPADDVLFASEMIRDWGLYTQLLWGFRRNWAAGIRYEYAAPEGDGEGAETDPFRDVRHRVSPVLVWQLTEFSRLRLQYNYDRAEHLEHDDAHSVWLGAEILFGAHAAHNY